MLEPRLYLAGDPLADWRFDSNSGTALVDSIGTAHGMVTGSSVYNATATALVNTMPMWTASNPTQWGTGTRDGALRLFSDTDGALVDAAVAPQVQSVSLWFKTDTTNPTRYNSSATNGGSTSGTSVAMPLFESGDSASGLNIYIYNNRLYVGAWNSAVAGWSAGTFLFTAANVIVAGRWHHVTVTLNPTAALTADGAAGLFGRRAIRQPGARAAIVGPAAISFGRTDGTTRFLLGTSGSSVVNNDGPSSNNHRGFCRVYRRSAGVRRNAHGRRCDGDPRRHRAPGARRALAGARFGPVGDDRAISVCRPVGERAFRHQVGQRVCPRTCRGDQYIQQNLNRLEMSWDILVDAVGHAAAVRSQRRDLQDERVRSGYGAVVRRFRRRHVFGRVCGERSHGLRGDVRFAVGAAQSQNPRSITVAPWGDVANTTTTPHEFTHALQSESQGFANSDFSGPFWETHANFGASLVADFDTGNGRAEVTTRNSINGRYGQRRHRYSLATDFRYEAHPFLNYLADLPGYGEQFVMGGLWSDPDAQGGSKDPWQVLRNNFSSAAEFASVYAAYVASSVTYKSLHNGALLSGIPSIPAHNTAQRLFRTYLEPVTVQPGLVSGPRTEHARAIWREYHQALTGGAQWLASRTRSP